MPRWWSSTENSEHQGLKEFPVWQYSMCSVIHWCQESNALLTPWREDNWKFSTWNYSWSLPHALLPMADLKLYPFSVINSNHTKYNSFQWCLWIFFIKLSNLKWSWGPLNLQLRVVSSVLCSLTCCRTFHVIRNMRYEQPLSVQGNWTTDALGSWGQFCWLLPPRFLPGSLPQGMRGETQSQNLVKGNLETTDNSNLRRCEPNLKVVGRTFNLVPRVL